MDPEPDNPEGVASNADPTSEAGVTPAEQVADLLIQEDVAPGVLSGIGPNAQQAGVIARDMGWTDPVPFSYSADKDGQEWAGIAARYEWDAEYGEVGPANPELEAQLFHGDLIPRAGLKLDGLNSYKVNVESPNEIVAITDWNDFGLHPVMLKNILLCQYDRPTAVQSYAIPAVMNDQDLIAIAQTGSGKTGAFLIPILSKLMGKAKKLAAPRPNVAKGFDPSKDSVRAEPLVLIVCPTRELATQIFDEARRLCYRSMLRPCVVYGGAPSRLQREELLRGCDILIATPGRLLDFMEQTHILSLRRVRYTVIDEADEMLDTDWEDEFKRIMSGGDLNEDDDHRYMMFSATFNKEFRKLAKDYLGDDHVRLRVGRAGSSHQNVVQEIVWVDQGQKMKALYDLLISMPPVRTLIFVNSKDQVDFVDDYLYNSGLPTTSIHSGRNQVEREDAMRSFRCAKCPIMVATGVTARGLDVINVLHVVNYDLPSSVHGGITEYVHRIGRTARIGNEGIATSFYNERNEDLAEDLVKNLVECKQTVPDFLEQYRPENDALNFDDNSEDDFFDAGDDSESEANSEARSEAASAEVEAGSEAGDKEENKQPSAFDFGTDDIEQESVAEPKKAKKQAVKAPSSFSKGGLSDSVWASDSNLKSTERESEPGFWDKALPKSEPKKVQDEAAWEDSLPQKNDNTNW